MADSDITVSGLTMASGIDYNIAKWVVNDPHFPSGLNYLQLDAVELWSASSNNRAGASKVDEGHDKGAEMAIGQNQTRYYWVRPRNKSGRYGDWFPLLSNAGIRSDTSVGDTLAWTFYVPTVLSSAGALGAVSPRGWYKRQGTLTFLHLDIVINGNGTGSGYIRVSLPSIITTLPDFFTGSGVRIVSGGQGGPGEGLSVMLHTLVNPPEIRLRQADGAYPAVDGTFLLADAAFTETTLPLS